MKIVNIIREPVEFIKRNFVGNVYKYRWCVYIVDESSNPYGDYMRMNNKDVKVKKIFIGTKPEVKKWLIKNKLKYRWLK